MDPRGGAAARPPAASGPNSPVDGRDPRPLERGQRHGSPAVREVAADRIASSWLDAHRRSGSVYYVVEHNPTVLDGKLARAERLSASTAVIVDRRRGQAGPRHDHVGRQESAPDRGGEGRPWCGAVRAQPHDAATLDAPCLAPPPLRRVRPRMHVRHRLALRLVEPRIGVGRAVGLGPRRPARIRP